MAKYSRAVVMELTLRRRNIVKQFINTAYNNQYFRVNSHNNTLITIIVFQQ